MPPRTLLERAFSHNETQQEAPSSILPFERTPLNPQLASADKPSTGSPNWANMAEPIVVANKDGPAPKSRAVLVATLLLCKTLMQTVLRSTREMLLIKINQNQICQSSNRCAWQLNFLNKIDC